MEFLNGTDLWIRGRRWAWKYLRELHIGLILLWVSAFVGGALCARCRFLDSFTPAGLAWAAAWGTAGVGYMPACVGLLAVWIARGEAGQIAPLVLLSILLAVRAAWPLLSRRKWTGFAVLALSHVGAFLGDQLPLEALLDLLNLAFTVALYAAFCLSASFLRGEKNRIAPEHWMSLALSLGALLSGLPGGAEAVFDLSGFCVMLTVLACARLSGAAAAGSAGLAAGLALYLSGQADAAYVCILGGAGLCAGSLKELGFLGPCAGFWMGACALSLFLTGHPASAVAWQAMAAGTFLYCLAPRAFWKRLGERIALPAGQASGLPAPDAQKAAQRLLAFAQCFGELSEAMDPGGVRETAPWEDAMPILEHVAQEACVDCPRRELCWKKEFPQTATDLMAAARVQEEERRILFEEDLPERFAGQCLRTSYVTDSLRRVCGTLTLRARMREEVQKSRTLVGRQLQGVSRVMEQLAREMSFTPVSRKEEVGAIRVRLKAKGIAVRSLNVLRDASGRVRVRMVLDACEGGQRCVGEILPILQTVLGCPMQWQPCACGGDGQRCRLTFMQARLLSIQSCALQWAAASVCGDACIRLSLGDRGYLLALSDGMGVGDAAAKESQRLLKLVEEFYRAGFEEELIFSTVNEMLLLRPGGETFATLDICLVDLVHSRAHFVKLGAAPSYLIREDRSVMIASPSLPVGIVEEMRPSGRSVDLLPGDVIIMGSDGIVTCDADFSQRLTGLCHLPPERMARTLMQEADDRENLRLDDRTLIVARIQGSHRDRAEELRARRMMRWKARVS